MLNWIKKGKDITYKELLELRKKIKDLERDNDILKKVQPYLPSYKKKNNSFTRYQENKYKKKL